MSRVRHTLRITNGERFALVREYRDGREPGTAHWCGREFGWRLVGYQDTLRPKQYTSRGKATAALRRIMTHERELGLAGARYSRI